MCCVIQKEIFPPAKSFFIRYYDACFVLDHHSKPNIYSVRAKHDLIGCLYMFSVTGSIAIARFVFSS